MPTLTPIDFDPFYDATGADKPAPVGKTQLLGNLLFGALPGPAKLASLPLNENFRKGFMEGMEKSGRVGVQSMMEALENQYKPDNAVAVNDAGEWLDQSGKVIPSQRRPNILPVTKSQPGEGWFGSNFEGAMPAMADVWNTMGGVAGKGGVTLGAGPMLRPALKYGDKIYKAKEGQQHLDALPAHLQDTFQKMAMSGEDISHFDFGFINHKGHFLSREKALEYAIKEGILDPNDAKYGTLVTTMLNDSGGVQKLASQAAAQSREMKYPLAKHEDWWGQRQYDQQGGRMETMSPDEFLNKSRPLKIDESSRENIEELKQHILSGKTLDPLNLQQGGKEDGRHRAIAAKELGIKEVPVINFRPSPTFYSAAEKAVEGIKQNKASGEQWLSTIGNQKGVKGEELEWIGLKEFLKDKPSVTKQEIQDYLKNNKVELQEVWKGFDKKSKEQALKDFEKEFERPPFSNDELIQFANKPTKYHDYQLPGGENYRELLLTLPQKKIDPVEFGKQWYDNWVKRGGDDDWEKLSQIEKDKWIKAADEQANGMGKHPDNYQSSHWDEPNILAHMRMNDRTIDGKKSLHLEEIQSDWHQQGRDKGYKTKDNDIIKYDEYAKDLRERAKAHWYAEAEKLNLSKEKADQIRAKTLPDDLPIHQVAKYLDEEAKLNEMWNNRQKATEGVPDAPFKKTWHELALKRAIREAAENGYERLSWTPGEAQAARYDLSKQIEKISYNPQQKYLKAWDHKGKEVVTKEDVTPENLADYIGKEAAEKVMKQQPKDFNKLSDVERKNLKVEVGDHQYTVRNNDGRTVNIGKGTVSSEEHALDYAERYFNNNAKEINSKRELEYGRLGPTHVLSGQDLKIGGEGMKGFYDNIIPKSIEKIAKEFGVKVQKGEVGTRDNIEFGISGRGDKWYVTGVGSPEEPFKTKAAAEKWINDNPDKTKSKQPIFYIDIPENMRQSIVGKGQPLFSGTPVLVPVNYNPFEQNEQK